MNNIVYHGSDNGNLEFIRANISTHQKKMYLCIRE